MSETYRPVNFRDVGETLALLVSPSPIVPGRLFRGGKFDSLATAPDLSHPATIVNLRRGADPDHLEGIRYLHFPAANDAESYDTSRRNVRTWLELVLTRITDSDIAWPCYLHCTSGRDRTGVVVASILHLLDVPRATIVEEYLLSEGAKQASIEEAIDGLIARPLEVSAARLRTALTIS